MLSNFAVGLSKVEQCQILLMMIIFFLRRFVVEILGKILKNAWPEVDDERITEELFDLVMCVLVEDASEEKNTFLT